MYVEHEQKTEVALLTCDVISCLERTPKIAKIDFHHV
jgi:hypothetical protein